MCCIHTLIDCMCLISVITVYLGAVYAYRYFEGSTGWSQTQVLEAFNGMSMDNFGYRLSLYRNNLAVGALTANSIGAVYMYHTINDGLIWSQMQKITAIDGSPGDKFSTGLALYRNILVIGSPGNSGRFFENG